MSHVDAEALHRAQRDRDVRLRDELSLDLDASATSQWQCQQQRRQELRRYIAPHPYGLRECDASRVDAERRESVSGFVIDPRPNAAERIDQIADRAFVHPRNTVQAVLA